MPGTQKKRVAIATLWSDSDGLAYWSRSLLMQAQVGLLLNCPQKIPSCFVRVGSTNILV
jgi:hypothetical protein